MNKKLFVLKVAQMSGMMLILNFACMCFDVYISEKIGAASVGMYHLILSVYSVAMTFSISGIGLTATRLVSESRNPTQKGSVREIVKKCTFLCLATSLCAAFLLFAFSGFIAEKALKNPDCAWLLKLLSLSLPLLAISTVFKGCFTAQGRVGSITLSRFSGELVTCLSTVLFLEYFMQRQMPYAAVIIGLCSGCFAEFFCDFLSWRCTKTNVVYEKADVSYKSVLLLCTPLALGSYLRTGLVSAENLLIPSNLAKTGIADSLGQYGIIKGMTMPLLLFPYMLIGAFTTLLVPELAAKYSRGHKNGIRYVSELSLEFAMKYAIFVSTVFFLWHKQIAAQFFSEENAGIYLGLLSLLPLFMLTDTVVDSMLKGLNQQVGSLKINIVDSIFRIGFILLLIPKFGIKAYICILYCSEILNVVFSYRKLYAVSKATVPVFKGIVIPLCISFAAFLLLKLFPCNNFWSKICLFAASCMALNCMAAVFIRPREKNHGGKT